MDRDFLPIDTKQPARLTGCSAYIDLRTSSNALYALLPLREQFRAFHR